MLRSFSLGLALAANAAGANSQPNNQWSNAARKDVEAGYRLFRDNHPGWEDKTNPGFRPQLERARKLGFAAASTAKDEADYEDALGGFSAALSDGHARLIGTDSDPNAVPRWPGFTTAWRGQRLLVAEASRTSPVPIGAEIVRCGRKPIRQFITARLEARGMRPSEAGQWWSKSPRAFVDSSDASGPPPSECTFRIGSKTNRQQLQWTPAPSNLPDRLKRASDGERTPIGLHEPRPGLFLIGLPDFDPDEAGRAAYRQMFADIEAKRDSLRQARAIIIDLRYNDGGADEWALETAKALWGRRVVEAKRADSQKAVQIRWRASPGNIAYVNQLATRLRQQGSVETADEIGKAAKAMQAASAAGHPFATDADNEHPVAAMKHASDFTTPVYVIMSGRCASACLDAVDTFKLFPNTKLIGAPTSADSQYLEIRTEPLPSGHGIAIIPIKVWMYRPRKSGQVYRPDVEATQLDWSTKAFLDIVGKSVTQDGS